VAFHLRDVFAKTGVAARGELDRPDLSQPRPPLSGADIHHPSHQVW
jgi:hypothetical protein